MSWIRQRRLTSRLQWNIPIRLQLSGIFALLLIAILAILGVLVSWQNEQFLLQTQRTQLEQHIVQAMTQFESNEYANPSTAANVAVDEAAKVAESLGSSSIGVYVFSASLSLLAQSYNPAITINPVSPQVPRTWPIAGIYIDYQQIAPMTQHIITRASGERVLVLTAPVNLTDEGRFPDRLMLIEVVSSLQLIDEMLGQLHLFLWVGIGATVILGVLVGQKLTQILLHPLDRLVQTAAKIAVGDLDQRLELPSGRNEMARLGQSFDHMVDRLAALLAMQRRFVADASHELRTPLTSLQTWHELLLMGADQGDFEKIQRAAHLSYHEIERLNRLVGDLLTLSRLDGASTEHKATINLRSLLQEVCEQMQPSAASRHVQIQLLGPEEMWITIVPDQFKQVVINLLDNAIRHSFDNGNIEITYDLIAATQTVRLEIIDHGSGIVATDFPHIFERFYRGDRSRQHATGNSGLGLAIVQSIVHAHGGTIAVQSHPLVATCFTLEFPSGDPDTASLAQRRKRD